LGNGNPRIGGCGIKFRDTRHRNLYHWLLGDSTYYAGGTTYPLPFGGSYDHKEPPEVESWRIYLELLSRVSQKRPLTVSWIEAARPGDYSNRIFEFRFKKEDSIVRESLTVYRRLGCFPNRSVKGIVRLSPSFGSKFSCSVTSRRLFSRSNHSTFAFEISFRRRPASKPHRRANVRTGSSCAASRIFVTSALRMQLRRPCEG
jgi:hypothetical protein